MDGEGSRQGEEVGGILRPGSFRFVPSRSCSFCCLPFRSCLLSSLPFSFGLFALLSSLPFIYNKVYIII
nr:MAG TPA: hypothetical protein [Caudoviricetes sp.]